MKKSQKSLKDWTDQEWTTKSGKPSTQGSKATGERYLPKKAIAAMSDSEYAASSRKKREDTKKGKQFSKQPKKAAKTARRFRNTGGIMNGQSSMLAPVERQAYAGGALVKTLLKLIRPLTKEQQATRKASAAQASVIKDKTAIGAGAAVVAGGIGYNINSPEGSRLIEAANAGEIEIEIKNIDQRTNPKDFPTYAKNTDSAAAFREAFKNAREARADTFEFEGRTYLADLPVKRENKAAGGLMAAARKMIKMNEGGSMMVPTEGMPVDTYPNIPPEEMAEAQASQLPDGKMEQDYFSYVINETLDPTEQEYLKNALEADPQLVSIISKVVMTASEFSGAGEVEGPGTGVSDSIPARLSDGEFVMTRKATDQIGADNLQVMMDEAERAYDGGLMSRPDSLQTTSKSNEDIIQQQMAAASKMPSVR